MTTGTVEERTETVSVTKEECLENEMDNSKAQIGSTVVVEKSSKLCGEGNITNPVKPDTEMGEDNVIKEKILKKVINASTGEPEVKKENIKNGTTVEVHKNNENSKESTRADDASVGSSTEAKVNDITKTAAEVTKMKDSILGSNKTESTMASTSTGRKSAVDTAITETNIQDVSVESVVKEISVEPTGTVKSSSAKTSVQLTSTETVKELASEGTEMKDAVVEMENNVKDAALEPKIIVEHTVVDLTTGETKLKDVPVHSTGTETAINLIDVNTDVKDAAVDLTIEETSAERIPKTKLKHIPAASKSTETAVKLTNTGTDTDIKVEDVTVESSSMKATVKKSNTETNVEVSVLESEIKVEHADVDQTIGENGADPTSTVTKLKDIPIIEVIDTETAACLTSTKTAMKLKDATVGPTSMEATNTITTVNTTPETKLKDVPVELTGSESSETNVKRDSVKAINIETSGEVTTEDSAVETTSNDTKMTDTALNINSTDMKEVKDTPVDPTKMETTPGQMVTETVVNPASKEGKVNDFPAKQNSTGSAIDVEVKVKESAAVEKNNVVTLGSTSTEAKLKDTAMESTSAETKPKEVVNVTVEPTSAVTVVKDFTKKPTELMTKKETDSKINDKEIKKNTVMCSNPKTKKEDSQEIVGKKSITKTVTLKEMNEEKNLKKGNIESKNVTVIDSKNISKQEEKYAEEKCVQDSKLKNEVIEKTVSASQKRKRNTEQDQTSLTLSPEKSQKIVTEIDEQKTCMDTILKNGVKRKTEDVNCETAKKHKSNGESIQTTIEGR